MVIIYYLSGIIWKVYGSAPDAFPLLFTDSMTIYAEFKADMDYLCDYTFNFYWHNKELEPDSVIPFQTGTEYTYRDFVDELKACGQLHIKANAGRNFAYSLGADLQHLGGSGKINRAGTIFLEGNAGPETGMGMVSGVLYISGRIEYPLGNIIELESDVPGYRKFRSVTDILCNGTGGDKLTANEYNEAEKTLILTDGIPRGTIAARCPCDATVIIENDAHNGTGMLAEKGTVIVKGNAGMNTGSHLNGATVAVHGNVGEFAGAYMKKGILAFLSAGGFIGAGMQGGTIYSKSRAKTSPPAARTGMKGSDSPVIRKLMDTGRVESMLYNKYGKEEIKEKYVEVRMRDGSIVRRKIE